MSNIIVGYYTDKITGIESPFTLIGGVLTPIVIPYQNMMVKNNNNIGYNITFNSISTDGSTILGSFSAGENVRNPFRYISAVVYRVNTTTYGYIMPTGISGTGDVMLGLVYTKSIWGAIYFNNTLEDIQISGCSNNCVMLPISMSNTNIIVGFYSNSSNSTTFDFKYSSFNAILYDKSNVSNTKYLYPNCWYPDAICKASIALSISSDGKVIFGFSFDNTDNMSNKIFMFIYKDNIMQQPILDGCFYPACTALPPPLESPEFLPNYLSPDGTTIIGRIKINTIIRMFKYTITTNTTVYYDYPNLIPVAVN